ncbi:MAG: N-acetyltransferase [Desulfotalea sp.]
MKIRKPTDENSQKKAAALLFRAFPNSKYEENLIEKLRKNDKDLHEWIALHSNKVIGYIAFSNAYHDGEKCGLHLAPLAVHPEFQGQGIGTELMKFALRQKEIKGETIYVLGKSHYYQRFGFENCKNPICTFTKNNKNFLLLGETTEEPFTIGYEKEFNS